MEDNLQTLLECNQFRTEQSEIFHFINKKCSSDLSISLDNLNREIDNVLNSDYVKQMKNNFDNTEKESCAIVEEIGSKIREIEEIKIRGKYATDKSDDVFQTILEKCEEIHVLEKQYESFEMQESQMELISAIQSCLILDDIGQASEFLVDLMNELHIELSDNERQKYIVDRFMACHGMVREKLTKQMEEFLKEINWPFISNSLRQTVGDLNENQIDAISGRFCSTFKHLLLIEIPERLQLDQCRNSSLINTTFMLGFHFDAISLPVQLLLRALVNYFKFFFWTDSKVNKLSKPEWYMSQVIHWIAAHHGVLGQLLVDSMSDMPIIDGRLEFIRGLVIMVMEKVHRDIELISTCVQGSDELLFHLIEESITMTTDLRKSFDYPRNYPDPIDVFCNNNESFDNWMKLEQRFAAQQLDEVLRDSGAWRALSSQCKRVGCLNNFIGLISTTKERIQCISDIDKQSQFCEVLLEVLDDFRRRLLQISKEYDGNSERWCDILNVVYGVKVLLRSWRLDEMFITIHDHCKNKKNHSYVGEDLESAELRQSNTKFFTSLSLYSNRTKTIENLKLSTDSVFSDTISLYQHMLDDMAEQCIDSAFQDVADRAEPYIKSSWLEISSSVDAGMLSLSPSASGMLLVLRDRLHGLESSLEPELFEHVWQQLAIRLNELIFDRVVRVHKFNSLGANQLDFDLTKNIIPLFLPYTKTPNRFFTKCLEACRLLTLKCGSAMLIKQIIAESLHENGGQSLFRASRPECPIRTLSEIGVSILLPEQAEHILNLRVDLSVMM